MKKRIAAEWEPAVGVMVAYPISLPRGLVCELAKDTTLYLLCPDDDTEIENAKQLMRKWGIDADSVRYFRVPKGDDSTWPRDWGPQPLFGEDGTYRLLGPSYVYSTPFCGPEHNAELTCAPWLDEPLPLSKFEGDTSDDLSASAISEQLGLSFVKIPLAFTGGNVLSDGVNSILSTEVLLLENNFKGFTNQDFFTKAAEVTGMSNYSVFSDYEDYSLQHVDCFLKILDDHRLLVQRPPVNHPLYQRYEDIVNNELVHAVNSYGKPWEILRIDTAETVNEDGLAAYVNSLILNKCVYVPMYSIPQDEIALRQWQEAMPGYVIKGFTFKLDEETDSYNPDNLYTNVGWDPGDVLHCRTRAVWDPQMLHIHVDTLDKEVRKADVHTVHATIVDYSKTGLIADKLKIIYRKNGGDWNSAPLTATPTNEVYAGIIPGGEIGDSYDYYIAAADNSGRVETAPRVAPEAYYTTVIA